MSECRLVFGALELTDPLGPYVVHGEGADLGNPVPVVAAMERMLQDGAVASTLRNDNRTQKFFVTVKGADGIALAENERALVLETGKRNTLSWTPPNGFAPTTVFDVQTSWLDNSFDDLGELRGERVYGLTITALPFGRSVAPVVIDTLTQSATPTTTLIDACDSATGWTGSTGSVAVDTVTKVQGTGSLRQLPPVETTEIGSGVYKSWEATYTRTGAAISMTGFPYLMIQASAGVGIPGSIQAWADGAELSLASTEYMSDTWGRYRFLCPDSSVSEVKVRVAHSAFYPTGTVPVSSGVWIDDLNKTDALPTGGTLRQSLRSTPVKGSVRSPGSLQIAKPGATSGLGHVLVYTSEDLHNGYRPDLTQFSTGSPTADSSTVSGKTAVAPSTLDFNGTNAPRYEVPAVTLRPGAYAVVARMRSDTVGTYLIEADATTMYGTAGFDTPRVISSRVKFATIGSYIISTLGVLHLPPTVVPRGTGAKVRVRLAKTSGGVGVITVDEVWLFSLEGALTHVDTATGAPAAGGPSTRVWVDTPSVEQPLGGAWMGTQSDKSDARHAGEQLHALGTHSFVPPSTLLFVVTTNAQAPDVTLSHVPHWHTNAAS